MIAAIASAQEPGRLAALTARGIAALEQERFTEALNALEEVWEQDQSDPAVAENLAMAYLYVDHDLQKARTLAEKSIQAGGAASFLVQHPHEKVGLALGNVSDFCSGRLSISRTHLSFVSKEPSHSFSVPKGQFKELKLNRVYGSGRGIFHIRTGDNKNYNLRPRTWSEEEQQLISELANQYLK